MADQQDEGQEKTEEPTARRLSKAREEGRVAVNIRADKSSRHESLVGGS